MNSAFADIGRRFLEDWVSSSPVTATWLGDHRFDHLLDEVDDAARRRRLESSREFLAELDTIDFSGLSRDDQVDFSLLRHRLRKQAWEIEVLREWEWNPVGYAAVAGSSLYLLLAREPSTGDPSRRLGDLAARCRALPRFLGQARRALAIPRVPRIHAETAVDQNQGIRRLIETLVAPRLGELPGETGTAAAEAVEAARAAVAEHQAWLEGELLPRAEGDPRLGEERYRRKFDFDLFSRFSPEELRARAERRMVELHDEMFALSAEIQAGRDPGFRPAEDPSPEEKRALIRATLGLANEDAPARDEVVDAARESLRRATAFVRDRNLVTLPDEPIEIIPMPEFRRGVSVAYCDAPGPLEAGGKTFYAVSPPPDEWTDEQVASFLREYNGRSIHNLTVHEAMPGHYVQLMRANAVSGRLRSVLASGTFIEGWAVYTEGMMVDEGFLEGDPLMRLIVLKWNLRGVANALLDQAVHLEGIDEAEAMRLMMDDAFQEEREAAGKWRRSLLTSVQLSTYFAGFMEVLDLRREVEEAWGDTFDLRTFHDRLTGFGSPPPVHVRALLLGEPIPAP